jgi:hypothetical protein
MPPTFPTRWELSVLRCARFPQYHNIKLGSSPSSSSQYNAMIDWLLDHGIPFSHLICKNELYSVIKLHKPRFRAFKLMLCWLNIVTLSLAYSCNTRILIWLNWYEDQLKNMSPERSQFLSRWYYETGWAKFQYLLKRRMELKMQHCPWMGAELFAVGTCYWWHFWTNFKVEFSLCLTT